MDIHNLRYCKNRKWSPLDERDPRCGLLLQPGGMKSMVADYNPCNLASCPTPGSYVEIEISATEFSSQAAREMEL